MRSTLFALLLSVAVHQSYGQGGSVDCSECVQEANDEIKCTCNIDFNIGSIDQSGTVHIRGKECSQIATVGGVWEGDTLDDTQITENEEYTLFKTFACDTDIKLRDLSFSDSGVYFCPVVSCGSLSVEANCVNWHNGNECHKAESCESCEQQTQLNTNGECVWCPSTSRCLIKGQGTTDKCQICPDISTNCPAASDTPTSDTFDCSSCNNPTVIGDDVSCYCNIHVDTLGLRDGKGKVTISSTFCSQTAKVGGEFEGTTISERRVTSEDEIGLLPLGICTLNFQLQELMFSESGMYFCPVIKCGSTTLQDNCVSWQGEDACLGTGTCTECTQNANCVWCASSSQCLIKKGASDKCGVCPNVEASCPNPVPAPVDASTGDRVRCHDCAETNGRVSCSCYVRIDDFGVKRNGDFTLSGQICSDVGTLSGTWDNSDIGEQEVSSTESYTLASAVLCDIVLKFNDLRFKESGVRFCPEVTCGDTVLSDINCVSWTSSTDQCTNRKSCTECLVPGLGCYWCASSGECLQKKVDQDVDVCGICPANLGGTAALPCVTPSDISINCDSCNRPSLSPLDVVSCNCEITESGKTGILAFEHKICSHSVQLSGSFDGTNIEPKDFLTETDTAVIQTSTKCSLTLSLRSPQYDESGASFCPELTCGNTKRSECVSMEIMNPCQKITSCKGCVMNDRCIWCDLVSECHLKKGLYDKCGSCGVATTDKKEYCSAPNGGGSPPAPVPPTTGTDDSGSRVLDCRSCKTPYIDRDTDIMSCTCDIEINLLVTTRTGRLVLKSKECSDTITISGEFDGSEISERDIKNNDVVTLDDTFCSTTIKFREVAFSESGVYICSVIRLCDGLEIYDNCIEMQESDPCIGTSTCSDCLTNSKCTWCLPTERCLLKNIHDSSKDKCLVCPGHTQTQQQFCPVEQPKGEGHSTCAGLDLEFDSCLSLGCLWSSVGLCEDDKVLDDKVPVPTMATDEYGGNSDNAEDHYRKGYLDPNRERATGGRTHNEGNYDTESDRSIGEQRVSKDEGDGTLLLFLGIAAAIFLVVLLWWGRRLYIASKQLKAVEEAERKVTEGAGESLPPMALEMEPGPEYQVPSEQVVGLSDVPQTNGVPVGEPANFSAI
eukprot:TRINITY_DN10508_c0_g1_i1.p1 TRINITY_DN10508_c0_g1~~TRINITY_DN10508_c0_g1_i1.p1  ORF type:complete len:1146 (+),score=229.44 TRINITY_DN10508_c0_g1_i1:86-3439(+)